MIFNAVSIIESKLNAYLCSRFSLNEQLVAFSNLSDDEALTDNTTQNKLLVTLVNIEREYSMGINFKQARQESGKVVKARPPLHLNFHLLLSANFVNKNYDESLKYISAALEFIQSNDLINHYNSPALNKNIEMLQLEILNLSFQEISNLWSILGGRYLPSILCKVRMLTIDKTEIEKVQLVTDKISINL